VAAACRSLLAGDEGVLDVAFAVGFESASAFHQAFRAVTRLRPGQYRRLAREDSFTLALPADFRADLTLAFLGRDPESPTERAEGGRRLRRALALPEGTALLHVEVAGDEARCRLEAAATLSASSRAAAHATALRLLGLDGDPRPFEKRLRGRPAVAHLVDGRRGLRIPQSATPFEALTWAIVGQQVNLPFAYRLRQRLIARAGRPAGGGLTAHPTAAEVARLDPADLARLQFSRRKAEYLVDAARAVAAGALPLAELAGGPATDLEEALRGLRGVGPWTARYVMLRGCGFADCVPVGDSGLTAALARFFALATRPGPAETEELMLPFAPYRSFATTHLWTSLGGPA
jgi:AraC family transcriptional regulator of adaptative response / DNA-3-methyladenine glycosylase II